MLLIHIDSFHASEMHFWIVEGNSLQTITAILVKSQALGQQWYG